MLLLRVCLTCFTRSTLLTSELAPAKPTFEAGEGPGSAALQETLAQIIAAQRGKSRPLGERPISIPSRPGPSRPSLPVGGGILKGEGKGKQRAGTNTVKFAGDSAPQSLAPVPPPAPVSGSPVADDSQSPKRKLLSPPAPVSPSPVTVADEPRPPKRKLSPAPDSPVDGNSQPPKKKFFA